MTTRFPIHPSALLCLALGLLAACSGSPRAATAPQPAPVARAPGSAAPAAAPQANPAVGTQVQRGREVYAQSCAACHGLRGEGGQAPALIGGGALPLQPLPGARVRTMPFRNAMDLGMFIKEQMPPGGPHTPPSDVASVMAWILTSNGVPPAQAISPATAGSIPIRR